jgi:phosphohistidine phosphatase
LIWLLRHGDAEDGAGKEDAARELTEEGQRQAFLAGLAMRKLGVDLDACVSSPRVRARQSAQLACKALKTPVEIDERLAGGAFDPLEIAAGRGEVLLVGHEPDLSTVVEAMTGKRVKMQKGGLAAIDGDQLASHYQRDELKQLAAG